MMIAEYDRYDFTFYYSSIKGFNQAKNFPNLKNFTFYYSSIKGVKKEKYNIVE